MRFASAVQSCAKDVHDRPQKGRQTLEGDEERRVAALDDAAGVDANATTGEIRCAGLGSL